MTPDLIEPASGRRRRAWRLKLVVLAALFATAAVAGTLFALQLFGAPDIPDVAQLGQYQPSIITRIYARSGEVIGEFAQERRILVSYDQIPPHLRDAIISVEDSHFYEHRGLNLRGIFRAAVENAKAGRVVEGGSSLTQQLAKLMFLTPERTYQRKIKEAVVALHIERQYSKEEILTFYCNQVYLGHNRYGVEAAARFYFGKHTPDLGLAEAALLAGLPQRPNALSPYRNPEAAVARRNHVLDRMREVGRITEAAAEAAKNEPLLLKDLEADHPDLAAHFVEEVRKFLEDNYGERSLYHDGLKVHTTLDPRLQAVAERAVRDGLLALDQRRGWRGAALNLLDQDPDASLLAWSDPAWEAPPRVGELVHGLVMASTGGQLKVRVGSRQAVVTTAPTWTRRASPAALYRTGDVGLFRVLALAGDDGVQLAIEQEPDVEGALLALDVSTGRVLAMVGGWDFRRSKFNRAVQAQRQTGSAFKPVVYAAAIGNGFTAADSLFDEPIAITDPWSGKVYSPENYSRSYYGFTTLREALEESRNPMSVQLLQRIGPHAVIDMARRLGISAKLDPYPSLALGAFEATLLEMTTAFSAFADLGVIHEPYLVERIEDREGHVLFSRRPVSRQAIPADVAFVANYMLQGVIQSGTGRAARVLQLPLAGKTGTTDDFTDAWFLGFSPSVVCGTWVGFDVKRTLGKGEVGARAALPIWMDFMQAAHDGHGDEEFAKPPGIEFATIDKRTGLRATSTCSNRFQEAFLRGTAPVTYCSPQEHEVRALPYYLQKVYLAGGTLPPLVSGETAAATKPDVSED